MPKINNLNNQLLMTD